MDVARWQMRDLTSQLQLCILDSELSVSAPDEDEEDYNG